MYLEIPHCITLLLIDDVDFCKLLNTWEFSFLNCTMETLTVIGHQLSHCGKEMKTIQWFREERSFFLFQNHLECVCGLLPELI